MRIHHELRIKVELQQILVAALLMPTQIINIQSNYQSHRNHIREEAFLYMEMLKELEALMITVMERAQALNLS